MNEKGEKKCPGRQISFINRLQGDQGRFFFFFKHAAALAVQWKYKAISKNEPQPINLGAGNKYLDLSDGTGDKWIPGNIKSLLMHAAPSHAPRWVQESDLDHPFPVLL